MKLNQCIRIWLMISTLVVSSAWAESFAKQSKSFAVEEKVRLQLNGSSQFQFAGYYAAVENGYYAEEGLDVEIKERIIKKSVIQQVITGESEYGVGDSGLLMSYAQGKPVVALAAIFQHSPLVYFSQHDSGITSPNEMPHKRIMTGIASSGDVILSAMLSGTGITDQDYTLVPHGNDIDSLGQGKIDVVSGYLTDQTFFLKKRDVKVNVIYPKNYGVDFYGDMLFTSQQELKEHPERADRFRRASLKGWRYALNNPEEMIRIISKKYHSKLSIEHLRFEAIETRKLILPDVIPLGLIEPVRIKMMMDTYVNAGFSRLLSEAELNAFTYNAAISELKLTDKEKAWLATHPVIRVGVDQDFAPYEWVDKDGHYVGMSADYMHIVEKKLGVRLKIIKDKTWVELLNMAKRGELDVLPCVEETTDRSQHFTFSNPYRTSMTVIVDNGLGDFIGKLEHLAGKKVAIENGYFIQEYLQKKYPNIQLILADSIGEALNLVIDGKVDGFVGDAGSTNYMIKTKGLDTLRFSGQTEYISQHGIAVTRSNPELHSMITKVMASIPKQETDAIFNRWFGLRIEQGIRPEALLKYGVALILLLLCFTYWIYRVRREISSRKSTEVALQKSDSELNALVNAIPNLIWLKDPDGVYLSCNHMFERLFGKKEAAIIGKTDYDFVDKAQADFFRENDRKAMESNQPNVNEEWLTIAENGYHGLFESTKIAVRNADGSIIGVLGIAHDITDRKRAEVEHKIAATVFESQEGMIITDANSVILRVNHAFSGVTGYSAEEVFGRNPRLFSSGIHGVEFYQAMWNSINNTGAWEGEIWNSRKNGDIYPEQLTITAVKDGAGAVTNYVATFLDITKRKQAEHALLEAKDVTEQALSEQSRFVSMLTHELRTPLSVLRMSLSLIEVKASLKQHINQALDDMSGIIERSSQVDLFEKRRLVARKESCQLDHVLDMAVSSSLAPSRFVIDLAPLPVLNSDLQLLRIIFSNLVVNAIKYSAPKTDINISAEPAMLHNKLGVCIYMQNQPGASGLPDPQRLFHKYYRSPGASGTTGSGLGLYLVHSLVELLGGRITYEFVQEKVTFNLWIPC